MIHKASLFSLYKIGIELIDQYDKTSRYEIYLKF